MRPSSSRWRSAQSTRGVATSIRRRSRANTAISRTRCDTVERGSHCSAARTHGVLGLARGRGRDRRLRRRRLGRCGRSGGELLASSRSGVDHYMAVPVRLVLAAVDVARQGIVPHDHVDRRSRSRVRPPTPSCGSDAGGGRLGAVRRGDEAEADGLLDEIVAALVATRRTAIPAPGSSRHARLAREPDDPRPRHSPPEADPLGRGRRRRSPRVSGRGADLLESMGARSIEANVRRRAAELCRCPTRPRPAAARPGGGVLARRRGEGVRCGRSTSSAWRSAPQPRNEPAVEQPIRRVILRLRRLADANRPRVVVMIGE